LTARDFWGKNGAMTTPWLILASASPRRRALLSSVGLVPVICPANVDETRLEGESPVALAERLAHAKASSELVARSLLDVSGWALGADTVVHRANTVFEKPVDRVDAVRILSALSGNWHEVTTGFCVQSVRDGALGAATVSQVTTRVRFRVLSRFEIEAYVETGEPLDKAGAYGIQGLGGALVAELQGSYTNVVGLPLDAVLRALAVAGAPVEGVE
jgi:septum formation protein